MNMLMAFWDDKSFEFNCKLEDLGDEMDDRFRADHTDWVYVDGEEGDHGVIRYFDSYGDLVCERVVHGGDREDWNFTDHGKTLMWGLVQHALRQVK